MDLEYSLKELYLLLNNAFEVKKRIYKYIYLENINNIDIFKYLSLYKWKNDISLSLSDIVSDIINVDNIKLYLYLHDR